MHDRADLAAPQLVDDGSELAGLERVVGVGKATISPRARPKAVLNPAP
jgi:hypothetical protein